MTGGHHVAYGSGLFWAGLVCVTGLAMAAHMNRLARLQNSFLLVVDARGWLLSGVLSLALLLAYGFAVALTASAHDEWVPYVDPAVLLCISLALLPVPLKTLLVAIRDVLAMAPEELDERVRSVFGHPGQGARLPQLFQPCSQIGRGQFIEIHILVPPDYRVETVTALDDTRRDVATRLQASWPQVWLNVDMTADPAYL